ncbi:hypothetical protein [uncultured Piscinibacter sp.]|nr:hypothetical protein [uncultured Piscinibacter sp.]
MPWDHPGAGIVDKRHGLQRALAPWRERDEGARVSGRFGSGTTF